MSRYVTEACVSNFKDALKAAHNGADQIELCSHLEWDGLSPDVKLLESVLAQITIPIKVMIRHRKGDFIYDQHDESELLNHIKQFKKYPIAGFVIGALTKEGSLDLAMIKTLCAAAAPFPVTLHKCIDELSDPFPAFAELKKISNLKFVLSSGGAATAWEGRSKLKAMALALAPEINLIAAGKITRDNLSDHHDMIETSHYHGKLIV